jgi:hypothetical protein
MSRSQLSLVDRLWHAQVTTVLTTSLCEAFQLLESSAAEAITLCLDNEPQTWTWAYSLTIYSSDMMLTGSKMLTLDTKVHMTLLEA